MTQHDTAIDSTLPEREQEILDTALLESDQLLARSLHDDDQRRRRRRLWLLTLAFGGAVMSGLAIAILAGWFAVGGQVATTEKVDLTKQEQEDLKREALQWRKRLLSASDNDPWHVGANIGMDLMRIPGDRPYELLRANWKRIDVNVRKQILKGFTPGMMGNERMHSRFFDVMDLGMSDSVAGVRGFAATYLEMQGLPNFEHDLAAYKRWRSKTRKLTAKEIVALMKAESVSDVDTHETPQQGTGLSPTTKSAEEIEAENEYWKERLLTVERNAPWRVGAHIGMDLVRIPGDRPYEILSAHWRKVPAGTRKQILKGFTPGMMGNKTMHPCFFDVMHLGMSDPDKGVRSFAASYIEMQGLPNFEKKPAAYKRWRKETAELSAEEIMTQAKKGS